MNETTTEALPVSAWEWMLHPVFARCVAPDAIRYDLSRPFAFEEYVYATDGRIAVRMPVPAGWSIPSTEARLPHLRDFAGMFSGDGWRRDPTQFPPVEGACPACRGAKALPEMTCPWCHAESPGPYEAGFCDGCWQLEGRIPAGPCSDCHGSGILDAGKGIEVAPGYWLRRKFVAMLHEFEMTTYLPAWRRNRLRTARFTLGDVTGVLMPMTSPDDRARTRSEAARADA